MAKGKMFEYAVLYHPKTKKNAAGEVVEEKASEVVKDVTRVMAGSEQDWEQKISAFVAQSYPATTVSPVSASQSYAASAILNK